MDILEKLDLITLDSIDEIFKKVIRKGKVKRKLICPLDIMKAKDGKCVLIPPAERKRINKAAILRGKKLHANIGVQKKAQKKRAKSMKKRKTQITDVNI